MRVLAILGHAFKAEGDMAVRLAVIDAMLEHEDLLRGVAGGRRSPA